MGARTTTITASRSSAPRQVTVAGNHFANNGDVGPPATWAGISVTAEGYGENGRSQSVTIRDNRIAGSQHGIYVDTADHVLITANKIAGTVHDAVLRRSPPARPT